MGRVGGGGGGGDFADEAKNYCASQLKAWGCVRWVGIEGERGCKRRGGVGACVAVFVDECVGHRHEDAWGRGEVRGA